MHTEAVPENKKSEAKDGRDSTHSKLLRNARDTRGVNGRADINGKREQPYLTADKEFLPGTPVLRILGTSISFSSWQR